MTLTICFPFLVGKLETKGQNIYECKLWDKLMRFKFICPNICIPFFMEPLIKSEYNPGNIKNLCTDEEYRCISNKAYWGIVSPSEICPFNHIGKT